MTDFHAHILPVVDDGSRSISESCEMLAIQAAQGVGTVCATPHYYCYRESSDDFLKRRNDAYKTLCASCDDKPDILLGAEVAFHYDMSKTDELKKLTVGSSDCVLIEMPFSPWTTGTFNEIYAVSANLSLTPVIAHIERYPDYIQKPEKADELLEVGALLQINAEYVISRRTRRQALSLLDGGFCLLGSDCHGSRKRAPNMGTAVNIIKKAFGSAAATEMLTLSDKILSGTDVTEIYL